LPLLAALLVGGTLFGGVTWTQLQGFSDQVASGAGSHEQAENPEVDGSVQDVPVQAAPSASPPASPVGGQGAEQRSERAADEQEKKPEKKPKKGQKGPRKPRPFFGSPFGGDLAGLLPGGKGRKGT
jgi:hypothetical protein